MGAFFKLLISPLLIPLVAAFSFEAARFLWDAFDWESLKWFLMGLGGYLILYPLLWTKNLRFIEVFEHELGHLVTLMSTAQGIKEFRVFPKENENYVEVSNPPINMGCLVTLAPYYLPVFTLPLLFVLPFTPASFSLVLELLIGITLGFHYMALFQEFNRLQTDLTANSMPFSFLITVLANVVILVLVVVVILDDFSLMVDYLWVATDTSIVLYERAIAWLQGLNLQSYLPT